MDASDRGGTRRWIAKAGVALDVSGWRAARKRLGWAFVIVGGLLQYAYSETRHPSTVLIVWAWIYRALFVVAIIAVIAWAVITGREWLTRRRTRSKRGQSG